MVRQNAFFNLLYLATFLIVQVNAANGTGESLLLWHPRVKEAPRVEVRVDAFAPNDLGQPGPGLGEFWPYASVPDFFAGGDPALRARLAKEFAPYLADHTTGLHPASPAIENPTLLLYTYQEPYQYNQTFFLDWLRTHRGLDDFVEPAGRRWNDYRENPISPWLSGATAATEATLKKAFGYVAWEKDGAVTLLGDNRYNPWRWAAPINEIHHHEQPSLAIMCRAREGAWQPASDVLAAYLAGDHRQHIYLEYDLALVVEDRREAMGEWSLWDYYGGQPLDQPQGLVAQTHWNARRYSMGAAAFGKLLPTVQRHNVQRWMQARLEPINIQCSIMVNFLEREGHYRLAEFMVASKNQQPIGFLPITDGDGYMYSPDPALNAAIVDGGTGGDVGWWRMPVNMLARPEFIRDHAELTPILLAGGEYAHIPDGTMRRNFRGVIDLTNFYALARARGIFPGQRGFAGGTWLGFEGDLPAGRNPTERHGIEWLGAIFENHGPFKVQMTVRALNATIASEPAKMIR